MIPLSLFPYWDVQHETSIYVVYTTQKVFVKITGLSDGSIQHVHYRLLQHRSLNPLLREKSRVTPFMSQSILTNQRRESTSSVLFLLFVQANSYTETSQRLVSGSLPLVL